MTHYHKLGFYLFLRWVSPDLYQNPFRSPKHSIFRYIIPLFTVQNQARVYSLRACKVEDNETHEGISTSNGETRRKLSRTIKREAQSALLDYLHSTRYLQFLDAEYMSKNSPQFLRKLVENVVDEPNVGRSMIRFLRYHPINEFEPFFESIGLEPSVFIPLLPRNLMFLSDEKGLLDNFHVLCEYGISRNKIGKIYSEAGDVFLYDQEVLRSKLQAFEEFGLSQPTIVELISSSPYLLIGDLYKDFIKVLQRLKSMGYEYNWVKGCLLDNTFYNWRQMFELLCMLNDLGCDDKVVKDLIGKHPELLFDDSGKGAFSLIGFVFKFGSTKNEVCSMFMEFPSVEVAKFYSNLRRVYELFTELELDNVNVQRIIRTHLTFLGVLSLKKANSILSSLRTGKKRARGIILENPMQLENWVLGGKIDRLPEDEHSHMEKVNFLSRLGFAENSKEMEKALKVFRGKGKDLQERFDCIVNAGLDENDVVRIIKAAPQILNQSKEVIEAKIEFLVDDLGYPISNLRSFPGYISYTTQRVKQRYVMFKLLSNEGVVRASLSLSTIVACTEPYFIRMYVSKHPRGPEMWCEIKKTILYV